MRGLRTTFRQRVIRAAFALASFCGLGAILALSALGAPARRASSDTATTSSTTTAQSTTSLSTTTESATTPASSSPVCRNCTPAIDIGAVTRPLLGFGYGGRRFPTGGVELVAVIITGDDNPVISRVTIKLPGRLSQALPPAERHLIHAESGRIRFTAGSLVVTLPKAKTAETITIPVAALASTLSTRLRFDADVVFQVRQGKATRRIGSEVAIG